MSGKKIVFSKIDLDHYVNQPDVQKQTDPIDEETEIKLFKNAKV